MSWLPVVATVFQAVGALSQASSARDAYNWNAQVSARNAQISRDQAAAAEAAQRRQADRVLGRMRAGYGASGVQTEGSPLDVLSSSVAEAELDALTTRYKGEMQATGYADEARMSSYQASSASRTGYMKASAALLGGYGQSITTASGTRAPVSDATLSRVG